ncbi:hypothetical protein L1987_21145 [Smallanthus sonchifolius]|uniref:Uncharacterized protein n=1 Tax=Smallanthus sonchifolius TaxID=185202 RepID=A0ACB9IWN3_9ASTR|nr:hypothetical protein L1987_21145 [Smallanthus sonchifolius]
MNHVLQEDLQHTSRLPVDETVDTFNATTPCETTDRWLRDPLDVVTENFPVTLRSSFTQFLASFSPSRHFSFFSLEIELNWKIVLLEDVAMILGIYNGVWNFLLLVRCVLSVGLKWRWWEEDRTMRILIAQPPSSIRLSEAHFDGGNLCS